jgi:hypothetical protein
MMLLRKRRGRGAGAGAGTARSSSSSRDGPEEEWVYTDLATRHAGGGGRLWLGVPTVLRHVIDERSPLYGVGLEDMDRYVWGGLGWEAGQGWAGLSVDGVRRLQHAVGRGRRGGCGFKGCGCVACTTAAWVRESLMLLQHPALRLWPPLDSIS